MAVTARDRRAWACDVTAALDALPTTQADALRLFYFEHLSDDQIAARLGVAVAHARTAVSGGLRRLGEALLDDHIATQVAAAMGELAG